MAISQYPAASRESYRRKRNCLPEIATAPLGPRNDKSGAFAILTVACTDCKCIAGLGCPLPCNAQLAALCHKINAAKISACMAVTDRHAG